MNRRRWEYGRFNETGSSERLRKAAKALADTMETCHICEGTVLVEEGPIHCEDCSYYCEEHEGPECPRLDNLHADLKRALAAMEAERVKEPEEQERPAG